MARRSGSAATKVTTIRPNGNTRFPRATFAFDLFENGAMYQQEFARIRGPEHAFRPAVKPALNRLLDLGK
jgi:hypothetical protein